MKDLIELELKDLTKKYKENIAVNKLSTTFRCGVYGLLGANGAGKTTLMRMICDILTPTSGEITLNGDRITSIGENYRALLGYLPQNFGYYPDYTAKEFMLYMAALKGIKREYASRQTKELLELVSLTNVANKRIESFSGGMKQRLGIAQAMLGNPRIIIFDEPTAGLDPKERVRFRNIIADLAKNKIVILSTHIVSDVEHIADKILFMYEGSIILSGTPNALAEQLEGKVWSYTIHENELRSMSEEQVVVNLHHEGSDQVRIRVVSNKKPSEHAILDKPMLEDFYLFYFQDLDMQGDE